MSHNAEPAGKEPLLIDVSHAIEHGMITYKGLPAPVICDYMSREASRSKYAEGTEFQIGRIDMVANTGTYVDSPFHRYADGKDLSELDLNSLANLDGVVIRVPRRSGEAITRKAFGGKSLGGKAVLVHTGWDAHWRTEQYFKGHPFLTKDAVEYLVSSRVRLVGIDSLNIDDTRDGSRPAHSLLLKAGIPIAEHMCNLGAVPDTGFRFFAVPVKVKGFGSFPVRAFCLVD